MKIPVGVIQITLSGLAGGILGVCGITVDTWQYWIIIIPLVGFIMYSVDQLYLYYKSKVNEKEKRM